MNINVTIVIQAALFFISYFFLKRYFFIPMYAVLQKQEAKKQGLEEEVFAWNYRKQKLEEQKKQQWLHIVRTLKSYIPENSYNIANKDVACPVMMSKKQKEGLAEHKTEQDQATNFVVEKLSGSSYDAKH